MSIHTRHNVDEVELLSINHFLGRTIRLGGEHLGAVQPRVSRSHNCDFRNPAPGFNVTLGEEAAPYDAASQDFGHIGLEWVSRLSGFPCIIVRI